MAEAFNTGRDLNEDAKILDGDDSCLVIYAADLGRLCYQFDNLLGLEMPVATNTAYVDGAVFFDLDGGFSRDAEGTGSAGLALLVNVPASTGTPSPLSMSYDGAFEGDLDIDVLGGAVTYLDVTVE